MSEEASPVTSPVIPPVSESHGPAQSQSQIIRTEEPERPADQPLLEVPPEPSKAPLHVSMSNVILESVPMAHISTSLAGGIRIFQFMQIRFFLANLILPLERLLMYTVLC